MRKQAFLLMASGILAFASCNTETDTGASDAQVDSMVKTRVDEISVEMMQQNDSLINAKAQEKADSVMAATKGDKSVPAKTTNTRTKAVESQAAVNGRSNVTTQSGQPARIDKSGSQTTNNNPGISTQSGQPARIDKSSSQTTNDNPGISTQSGQPARIDKSGSQTTTEKK